MQIVNERCYNSFMESNIIEKSKQNPYDEVYSILITLENDFINKLPQEILNNIIKNMSFTINNGKKKYNIQRYNLKNSLKTQGVSNEAISMIYYLYHNYWCDSEKEKKYLENVIYNNWRKKEKLKKEEFCNTDLFKKEITKENKKESESKKQENMLIVLQKEKWYKKIYLKLINLFKKVK